MTTPTDTSPPPEGTPPDGVGLRRRHERQAVVVVLMLVLVVVVGALLETRALGSDLRPRAVGALEQAGLDDIVVTFSGREASLRGGTSIDRIRAVAVVEGVEGVRRVGIGPGAGDAVVEGVDPEADQATAPVLTLRAADGRMTIGGTVADAEVAAEVKTRAAEAFGGVVLGDLRVEPRVGGADWVTDLPPLLAELADVDDLRLAVSDQGVLALAGRVETRDEADRLARLLATALPTLDVDDRLTVTAGGR